MDISTILPLLLAQNGSGTANNNLLASMLPAMMGQGKGSNLEPLLSALGANAPASTSSMMDALMKNQSPPPTAPPPSYDTNPQYLRRYYHEGIEKPQAVHSQQQSTAQTKPNESLNPMMSLLGSMMGQQGNNSINPLSLLPLLANRNQATTQSVRTDAPLTSAIEPFAPSRIVLNIRRMMSK